MDTWRSIDGAAPEEARRLLARACGSSRWIDRMLGRRPFGSREALLSAARAEWDALDERDWREAFTHHPKIGDREALRERFPSTHALSAREQAGVDGASDAVLDALAEGNRRYEERFGYIFIVCASGPERGRDALEAECAAWQRPEPRDPDRRRRAGEDHGAAAGLSRGGRTEETEVTGSTEGTETNEDERRGFTLRTACAPAGGRRRGRFEGLRSKARHDSGTCFQSQSFKSTTPRSARCKQSRMLNSARLSPCVSVAPFLRVETVTFVTFGLNSTLRISATGTRAYETRRSCSSKSRRPS